MENNQWLELRSKLDFSNPEVRVAFFRADCEGDFADKFIAGYTGIIPVNWGTKPYSHAEIGFKMQDGSFLYFSSTTRNTARKCGGPRFIWDRDLLRKPGNWDIYGKVFDLLDVYKMFAEACEIEATGGCYDWTGIFGFAPIFPVDLIDAKGRWYCSEVVYRLLSSTRERMSPRHLSKTIIKTGFVFISSKGIPCSPTNN